MPNILYIATSVDGSIANKDGGKTVQGFLKEDLIDEIIISKFSILLGEETLSFYKSEKSPKVMDC